ncbi:Fanconi anemia group J protein, partial [Linderina pennispora]
LFLGSRQRRRRNNGLESTIPPHINVLAFWSLNPGVIFKDIASKARSVILTSGTLSPLSSYASELQVEFLSTLEASHVIAPDRCWAATIACGPSGTILEAKYQTSEQLEFQDDVGSAILSIAMKSPDGMLVFVPSYALLNKLLGRWQATGVRQELELHKSVFVEPQGGSKKDFEKLLKKYRTELAERKVSGAPAQRGAVMFAVYRGKVSEGIDFKDYYCRTVVNIGIPFPAFKDVQVMLKRDYNDRCPGKLPGQAWYEVQAFRAINQALGRCLRHRMDWGAIIMLEARFRFPGNIEKLSKWVRGRVRVFDQFLPAMDSLAEFYQARIQEDIQNSDAAHFADMECDDDEDDMDSAVVVRRKTKEKSLVTTLHSFFYKPGQHHGACSPGGSDQE